MEENGRIPPYDEEAEINVLGSMLLEKESITTAVEFLHAQDFYRKSHGEIYLAILDLYNMNEPADLLTVANQLRSKGQLKEVGGTAYLAALSAAVVTTSDVKYYCKIVKDKSTLRKLIQASDGIMSDAYSQTGEVDALLEKAEKSIFDITEGSQRGGFLPMTEVIQETFETMQKKAENPKALTGLNTGFSDLNRKLSGLQKSDLVLLAARPSMGKTALMVNIATNAAMQDQARVAMFSLEMSAPQLVQRILSSVAHVDLSKIISANLDADEWKKIIDAIQVMQAISIDIDDTPGISPLELKAKCRKLKMEKGLDLIVIDYLQLMESSGRPESRQQEISAISRALKGIAKELDVPVLALSQLSRAPELRQDHRPILSDLRESGAIEQDADVVMFLYRDDYYHEDSEKKNTGELIIAKHRNGPTGTVDLVFKKEYTKFVSMEFRNEP